MVEDQSNKNNVITITTCVDPSCNGWLIDTFSGKYWIRCTDPKHNVNNQNRDRKRERDYGLIIKNVWGPEPHTIPHRQTRYNTRSQPLDRDRRSNSNE